MIVVLPDPSSGLVFTKAFRDKPFAQEPMMQEGFEPSAIRLQITCATHNYITCKSFLVR